jgi:radical SAM-linked protein
MRYRLRFAKVGKVRFTSHRDVARIWERGLRRAGIPVAYTEGFSPRPRLSFGLALPTAAESLGEYVDADLRDEVEPAALPALLTPALPAGMDVQAAVALAPGTMSLQQAVSSCTWRVEVLDVGEAAAVAAVDDALAAASLPIQRERKGHAVTDDVRPAIVSLAVVGPSDGGVELAAELATATADGAGPARGLRPAELVAAVLPGRTPGKITRTHQWTLVDGARREPIELPAGIGATSTPHAWTRAS